MPPSPGWYAKPLLFSDPTPKFSSQSTNFIAIVKGLFTLNRTILELNWVNGTLSFPTAMPLIYISK